MRSWLRSRACAAAPAAGSSAPATTSTAASRSLVVRFTCPPSEWLNTVETRRADPTSRSVFALRTVATIPLLVLGFAAVVGALGGLRGLLALLRLRLRLLSARRIVVASLDLAAIGVVDRRGAPDLRARPGRPDHGRRPPGPLPDARARCRGVLRHPADADAAPSRRRRLGRCRV